MIIDPKIKQVKTMIMSTLDEYTVIHCPKKENMFDNLVIQ